VEKEKDLRDRYLTTEWAAALLGRSPRTLQGWRARKFGPPFVKLAAHGGVLYRLRDIEQYLERHLVDPAA
jgi:hypothetical protein